MKFDTQMLRWMDGRNVLVLGCFFFVCVCVCNIVLVEPNASATFFSRVRMSDAGCLVMKVVSTITSVNISESSIYCWCPLYQVETANYIALLEMITTILTCLRLLHSHSSPPL